MSEFGRVRSEANSIGLCVAVSCTTTCEPVPRCVALHVLVCSGSGVFLGGTSSANVQMRGRTFFRREVIIWKPLRPENKPVPGNAGALGGGFWLLLHGSGNENSLLEALRSQLITNKCVFLAVRSLPADSGLLCRVLVRPVRLTLAAIQTTLALSNLPMPCLHF